jgi:hypothetical protein
MTNEPLNNAELDIISRLLEMAGADFSNHICNDFSLENTQENRFVMMEYEKDNCPIDPYPVMLSGDECIIYANNSALMSYMARRVKSQIHPRD